jgi:single-stranded-DNA-specific exonuclease
MPADWNIISPPPFEARHWLTETPLHDCLAALAWHQGLQTPSLLDDFLHPRPGIIHEPWLMHNMHTAVQRIVAARKTKESVLIYGDYDADGAIAVACMYHFLQQNGFSNQIEYYVPDRQNEGNGITEQGISFASNKRFNLIIALDCGSNAADVIEIAREKGIAFIICDHHEVRTTLPDNAILLNPKQTACNYPNQELSAAGVGIKLIQALEETWELPSGSYKYYLDLVAIALVADTVPLKDENRSLVYWGLQKINKNPSIGLAALIHACDIKDRIGTQQIIFQIAPKINAAGRMSNAKEAIDLLLSESKVEASNLSSRLIEQNEYRKSADTLVTTQAIQMLSQQQDLSNAQSIVVFHPFWHPGVIGIVATRLAEKHKKPCVVITGEGPLLTGSARSIHGVNIYQALDHCKELLQAFGGHFAAAGFTISIENLDAFRTEFTTYMHQHGNRTSLPNTTLLAGELKLGEIDKSLIQQIRQFEPFGPNNEKPLFIARKVRTTNGCKVIKESHIQFCFTQDNCQITGFGQHMSDRFHELTSQEEIDIIYSIQITHKWGRMHWYLQIVDFYKTKHPLH